MWRQSDVRTDKQTRSFKATGRPATPFCKGLQRFPVVWVFTWVILQYSCADGWKSVIPSLLWNGLLLGLAHINILISLKLSVLKDKLTRLNRSNTTASINGQESDVKKRHETTKGIMNVLLTGRWEERINGMWVIHIVSTLFFCQLNDNVDNDNDYIF